MVLCLSCTRIVTTDTVAAKTLIHDKSNTVTAYAARCMHVCMAVSSDRVRILYVSTHTHTHTHTHAQE
jgi:hypothetical protein